MSTPSEQSFSPVVLARRARALAFDLDGTLYLGGERLPGVLELLEHLRRTGRPVAFVTNNSSVPRGAYLEKLAGLGIEAGPEQLLTSNDAAILHLRAQGLAAPLLLASPEVEEEYRAAGFRPNGSAPDSVLLTFDRTLTYDKLCAATHAIRRGLPYFATHPDVVCPMPGGSIPDCGAFIALLESVTGARPQVLGKPARPLARALVEALGVEAGGVAFVGDRLYTDIRLAREHGFLGVLTLTGEAGVDDLRDTPYPPDLVVASLFELREHLRRADEHPGARAAGPAGR